jgi:ABC-type transporter Mla MlaB component
MLRILNTLSPATTTLHLQGKLLQPWIAEVQASVSGAAMQGAVRLDLSGLQFADESGLNLLRSLKLNGAELVEVPALIAALLLRADSPPAA